jgi:hypothetical protein
MLDSTLRISLATLFLGACPGCSLIFTHAPQPDVHPPPECTTSVAAPVVDTVVATASATLLGFGAAAAATPCTPGDVNFCGLGQAAGWGAIVVGAVTGILFTTSAVVGYQRTSACRASLEPNALLPQPSASLLPASSVEVCASVGDAPRSCPATLWNAGVSSPAWARP